MKTLSVLNIIAAFLLTSSLAQAAEPTTPTLRYWHMWTDTSGGTHQTLCELKNFKLQSMQPPASPQWQDRMKSVGATTIATVQPVGWQGLWHEDPKPQWIIPLSGRWFVETNDGVRHEMGPGEMTFGEDQNSKDNKVGHKGHLSGTVGDEPAVLMVIQMKDTPTVNQPCHFQ